MNSLETTVLRLIGEDVSSPDVFTDDDSGIAQIRESLNDAIQELCAVSGSYIRMVHFPLLVGQSFYRLTVQDDYMGYIVQAVDMERRTKLYRTDLIAINAENPKWMDEDGYPQAYFQVGLDTIGIYMRPSASGVILELKVVCIPLPYTQDTDPIHVREEFQRAAVSYAVSEFYASRGDAARATEYMQRYLETAGLMQLHPQHAERMYQLGGYQGGPRWQDRRREQ